MHDEDGMPHDHVMEILDSDLAEDIEGIERFTLYSVGIDIGSSTTHTIFSKLVLRREGAGLSAKFVVTERDVLYRSPVMLTPYSSGTTIDTESVTNFIQESYTEAGFTPDDIDTGAVVITGEALKKENAQPILEFFSEESGRFICASAGPMHEALLAAFGSGAVAVSKQNASDVLDVDIGGGTTKISLISAGEIKQMAAVEIGARLIAYDPDGTVTRVEQPARTMMESIGKTIKIGDHIDDDLREQFAGVMTSVLSNVLSGENLTPLSKSLMLTEPLSNYSSERIDHVMFSGGVSEYVYGNTDQSYGDIGPYMGPRIRAEANEIFKPGAVMYPAEGIRATVIGAGEYTLQASGSTSYIATSDVLPVRGIQVARALISKEQSESEIDGSLSQALAKYDVTSISDDTALALSVRGQPDYWYVRRIAEAVARASDPADNQKPMFLVLDVDIAKSLGGILQEELGLARSLIAVDGIEVGDLDYIDIGKPMGASEVIPVTVKSLIFSIRSASG